MEVKVEIIGKKDVKENERQSVTVETHRRRGDMFNVQKVDAVLENDSATFKLKGGDRLVITTPEGDEEIVYDRDQGAAVRVGSQENTEGRADVSDGSVKAKLGPGETATPLGVRPPTQTVTGTPAPQMRAAQSPQNPTGKPNPGHTPTPEEAKKKADEEAKAKALSESGTGRPAGESPPLPGSPVGSPPHGNEGKK